MILMIVLIILILGIAIPSYIYFKNKKTDDDDNGGGGSGEKTTWGCKDGKCIVMEDGTYSDSTCDGGCKWGCDENKMCVKKPTGTFNSGDCGVGCSTLKWGCIGIDSNQAKTCDLVAGGIHDTKPECERADCMIYTCDGMNCKKVPLGSVGQLYKTTNCDNACVAPTANTWGCQNGLCVKGAGNGSYTSDTCDGKCWGCDPTTKQCVQNTPGTNCSGADANCCGEGRLRCPNADGTTACCASGEACINKICCPAGRTCGTTAVPTCCPVGEGCLNGSCVPKCAKDPAFPTTADKFCEQKQVCVNKVKDGVLVQDCYSDKCGFEDVTSLLYTPLNTKFCNNNEGATYFCNQGTNKTNFHRESKVEVGGLCDEIDCLKKLKEVGVKNVNIKLPDTATATATATAGERTKCSTKEISCTNLPDCPISGNFAKFKTDNDLSTEFTSFNYDLATGRICTGTIDNTQSAYYPDGTCGAAKFSCVFTSTPTSYEYKKILDKNGSPDKNCEFEWKDTNFSDIIPDTQPFVIKYQGDGNKFITTSEGEADFFVNKEGAPAYNKYTVFYRSAQSGANYIFQYKNNVIHYLAYHFPNYKTVTASTDDIIIGRYNGKEMIFTTVFNGNISQAPSMVFSAVTLKL
jgi:hypothetical protein